MSLTGCGIGLRKEHFDVVLCERPLCWTGVGGRNSHDLLPLPRTEEAGCLAALDAALDEADFLDDPHALLARLPADRVRQIHVAGHEEHGGVLIDTHDRPVRDEVWDLHAAAVRRCGPVPTLIEWDTHLPGFDVLLAVAARADEGAQRALREGGEVHATVE